MAYMGRDHQGDACKEDPSRVFRGIARRNTRCQDTETGGGGDQGDQRGYDSDCRESRDYGRNRCGYGSGPRRVPMTCYNCEELGDYASQCPHPRRNTRYGPSSSVDSRHARSASPRRQEQGYHRIVPTHDPLQVKVVEISKSVAAVCQYVENEQQKKAAKERKKAERKEAAEAEEARQREIDRKKKKKEEKERKDVALTEEMNKKLDIKMAVRVGELREDVREDMKYEIREAINQLFGVLAKGKQKVGSLTPTRSESIASSSETEELSAKTRKLCINEKQKRAKNDTKTISPRKMPASIRKKKILASIGIVGRLKFEKQVMQELKALDALVLQNTCKEEGIPYNGKFEAIFNIAAHRTRMAYGTDGESEEEQPKYEEKDPVVVATEPDAME
ncbi:hypothetical protein CBR_g63126 [Chara braunii]|uniref:CCHC-type domain-containing protein n=1 Tax=Chara braunii TaxID=69332 RepID=A0A388K8Z2_CHABU|nr:hypothetical protein CBR_g63126 [Chara braunii]|eukprot:GBG66544.1 hypothetical protein CBR_g63126 [Chara braunii]